jgi:hypothetical protein
VDDPVVGYRRFSVPQDPSQHNPEAPDAWLLRPTYYSNMGPWRRGENKADCYRVSSKVVSSVDRHPPALGPPPAADHTCGLHAFYGLDGAVGYTLGQAWFGIVGSVIGWGKTFWDKTWWRAERAMVIALLHPDDYEILVPISAHRIDGHRREEAIEFARRYAFNAAMEYPVPLLRKDEIEEYTLQYGRPYTDFVTDDELEEASKWNRPRYQLPGGIYNVSPRGKSDPKNPQANP